MSKEEKRFIIHVTTNWCGMDTFDFQEALSYIKAGMVVGITIKDIEHRYYLNQFGEIMCTPNGKPHLTYKVNTFHIDAVMSSEWRLYE